MLLRDIFRFGTATVSSLLVVVHVVGARPGRTTLQRRPPRVGAVVVVVRVVREPCTALGAQARAVLPAHRLERQCEHHRVPQRGLEVDQVALELAQLVLVVTALRRPAGVHVQLLQVDVDVVVDVAQAPDALPGRAPPDRTGDEHPFHHRLEPQIQLEVGAFGTPITSVPRSTGAATVRCTFRIVPGRLPSSRVSRTVGDRGSRRMMCSWDFW